MGNPVTEVLSTAMANRLKGEQTAAEAEFVAAQQAFNNAQARLRAATARRERVLDALAKRQKLAEDLAAMTGS